MTTKKLGTKKRAERKQTNQQGQSSAKGPPEFEIHKVAGIFPTMPDHAYTGLRDDIRQHGLHEPIWTYQGKIIDGRHRYRACQELGIQCQAREFGGDEKDLVAFVVSLNMKRRHLNESQRAQVADLVAEQLKSANVHPGDTMKTAAGLMNVSRRSVATARAVRKECVPEVHDAVRDGTIKVSAAKGLAKKPKKEQQRIICEIKRGKAFKQAKRSPHDFYPTPSWVTEALLQALPPESQTVIEPAAGEGDIVSVLAAAEYKVHAIELRQQCEKGLRKAGASEVAIGDALENLPKSTIKAIVSNPPFEGDLGFSFVKACIGTGSPYVAMLLQLDYLCSRERAEWNNKHPVTALLPLGDRPSFTGDGQSDTRNYGWFIWIKGEKARSPQVLLDPFRQKARRGKKAAAKRNAVNKTVKKGMAKVSAPTKVPQ